MNIEKYLILIADKNGDFKEKTSDIECVSFIEEKTKNYAPNSCVSIKFFNNDKIYTYAKERVKIFDNPIHIRNDDKCQILQFGEFYRVIFPSGTTKLHTNIMPNTNHIFEYAKALSKAIGLKIDNEQSLLYNLYEKIFFISKESVLYYYLNPNIKIPHQDYHNEKTLLCPFGLNLSQLHALKNALSHKISIIEGPPGTGKTQSILSIAINLIYHNKTVAIVSNNNAATANVYEKLSKYNLGFICATLGKKENKEAFIESQSGLYPKILQDKIAEQKSKRNEPYIEELKAIFTLENTIAKAKIDLESLRIESQYFKNYQASPITLPKHKKTLKSQQILQSKIIIENAFKKRDFLGIFTQLRLILFDRIGDFRFYKHSPKDIIDALDSLYYEIRQNELKTLIDNSEKELKMLNAKNPLKALKDNSKTLLWQYLKKRYNGEKRDIFIQQDLYYNTKAFLNEYPIIFSTTHALKQCVGTDFLFDYVIIDEASQVDITTGILALSSCKNAIIVGDKKQLPNVIANKVLQTLENLRAQYQISTQYDYAKQSLLSSILEVFDEINAPRILLKEHYRCHPKIINFCNQKFYNNELIILTKDNGENDVIKVVESVSGNHARKAYNTQTNKDSGGFFNERQIDIIANEILPKLTQKTPLESIGIISPYNAQKLRLNTTINNQIIDIDTVHKFQGREKEAIIITTVANSAKDNEFIDDEKLLNVAISRAQRYLWLVISSQIQYEKSNINDFIRYIKRHNFEIIQSNICSIFDLLYKANSDIKERVLKGKRKLEFDSENLALMLIESILKAHFPSLSVTPHIPLFRIIKDLHLLDDEQIRYVCNPNTHIDFAIYHKMDKSLILAIEVDGYAFHAKGTAQSRRDELKNKILATYHIPLLRLSTISSNETEKLKSTLEAILKTQS